MTGDVLPCFDASLMRLPPHGAVVVTAPAPLDVASRHGVIVSAQHEHCRPPTGSVAAGTKGPEVVGRLLQKPRVNEMVAQGAIYGSGQALLDTGIFAVTGDTWQALIGLATRALDPVLQVLASGEEVRRRHKGKCMRACADLAATSTTACNVSACDGSHAAGQSLPQADVQRQVHTELCHGSAAHSMYSCPFPSSDLCLGV